MSFVVLTSAACSRGPQTGFDRDTSVNLKNFSTFKVEPEKGITHDAILGSELNLRRMSGAVTEAMETKGYALDEKQAEIVVKFTVDVRDRQEVRSSNAYYPYRRWWNAPMNDVTTYNYQEGRLVVNIYDARNDKMIWQGWLTGEVKQARQKDSPEEITKNQITEILKSFPESVTRI